MCQERVWYLVDTLPEEMLSGVYSGERRLVMRYMTKQTMTTDVSRGMQRVSNIKLTTLIQQQMKAVDTFKESLPFVADLSDEDVALWLAEKHNEVREFCYQCPEAWRRQRAACGLCVRCER